jgi:hypothetical protein
MVDFEFISADKLLALVAYGEAASEGTAGMQAVLNVIANRVLSRDPKFVDQNILSRTGSMWHAVILKPYQFSAFNPGDPVRPKLEQMAQNFDYYLQTNPTFAKAYELAKRQYYWDLPDITQGATYYHATYVSPSWASQIPVIGQLGRHIFYGKGTFSIASLIIAGLVIIGIILYRRFK